VSGASLGWSIAACFVAVLIGGCAFWAMEQVESSKPIPPSEALWARTVSLVIGLIISGALIRWWFLFAIAFLAGCAGAQPGGEAIADSLDATHELGSRYSEGAVVQEIHLRDGTPCAIVRSPRGAGIDCNWRAR
jgi:hypothetical protein